MVESTAEMHEPDASASDSESSMDEAEKKLRAELSSVVVTADQIHAHNKAVATERDRRKKLRDASSAATQDGQPTSGDHRLDEFQKHNAKRLDSLLARTLLQHSAPADDDAKPPFGASLHFLRPRRSTPASST